MTKGHIHGNYKKRAIHRLRITQGQLRGLEKMVTDEKYCIDILHQSLAVQESLKSFDALMLENHLTVHHDTAHVHTHSDTKNQHDKRVKEMLTLFRLRNQ